MKVPVRRILFLVWTLESLACCGAAVKAPGKDAEGDVGGDFVAETKEIARDTSGDLLPEVVILEGKFDGFRTPSESGPSVWLEPSAANGPNLISLKVMARGLGGFAGMAFHLEYPSDSVVFESGKAEVDMGSSGPYFTKSVLRELAPGRLIFGVARFCKNKAPWAGIDQCGDAEPEEPVHIATLTFFLKREGDTIFRFSERHALIRRADRSKVMAEWIGGRVAVRRWAGR